MTYAVLRFYWKWSFKVLALSISLTTCLFSIAVLDYNIDRNSVKLRFKLKYGMERYLYHVVDHVTETVVRLYLLILT